MIVIACYNDVEIVQLNVESILKTKNLDENILLVSTDPSKIFLINYLQELEKKYDLIKYFVPNNISFDSGAYINAYFNYIDEYYIFLQDSVIVNDTNWLNQFKKLRSPNNLNAWITFDMPRWDYQNQKDWVLSKFSNNIIHPHQGIFGPIFQISRQLLDKMNDMYNLLNFIPDTKINAMGMERGWAYLSANTNSSINNIEGEYSNIIFENTTLLKKKFYNRY